MSGKFLNSYYDIEAWSMFLPVVLLIFLTACSGPAAQPEVAVEPTAAPAEAEAPAEATAEPEEAVAGERGSGDTLRLLYWQAPTILNPHLSQGNKDLAASRIVYEPLASFDKDGNLVPFLAAEIPSLENGGVAADGTSVTWKLQQGVLWSDGEPFTAGDVLFTYQYITNPEVKSTSALAYASIENVEALDDNTVQINFAEPNFAWFLPFVGPQGMIIPRHIFETYNGPNATDAPANTQPVGTGPYRFVEFKNEDILIIGESVVNTNKITYEANPHFREADKPYFSTIELQGGGSLDTAVLAAKEGLIDFSFALRVPDDVLAELESGGHSAADFSPTAFVERIMLNFTDPNQETADGERSSLEFPHPFLTDLRVRQAIAMAIDREAIAKAFGQTGTFTTNILVEPPYYNSPNTVYEYNPEQAKLLLDEAGWVDSDGDGTREKGGIKLRVVFQTSIEPLRQISQEQVKQDLEAIGFEVELKIIDASIFFGPPENTTDTRRQFYADLEEFAFSNKSPDPIAYLAGWTCAETAQKSNQWALTNWARYCNSEYDALFSQVITELDPDRRAEMIIQLNDILIEDVAVIPVVQQIFPNAVNLDLDGVDFTPWDVEVWNIKDWRREE